MCKGLFTQAFFMRANQTASLAHQHGAGNLLGSGLIK